MNVKKNNIIVGIVCLGLLCTQICQIFIDSEGNCIEIISNGDSFSCDEYVKEQTDCWDTEGKSQLCNAYWLQADKTNE